MNVTSKNGEKLITYEELSSIIEKMGKDEFTVLDLNTFICNNYSSLYNKLKQYYANEKGYSQLNYLSNLLCRYSKLEDSVLQPHISYYNDNEINVSFRKPTDEEKISFKGRDIAIYRCK